MSTIKRSLEKLSLSFVNGNRFVNYNGNPEIERTAFRYKGNNGIFKPVQIIRVNFSSAICHQTEEYFLFVETKRRLPLREYSGRFFLLT